MHRGKNKHLKPIQPSISYRQASSSYFAYEGKTYPVSGVSSNLFREAIYAHAGDDWDKEACDLLEGLEIDFEARWYILNRLMEKDKPLNLIASNFEAKQEKKEFEDWVWQEYHERIDPKIPIL